MDKNKRYSVVIKGVLTTQVHYFNDIDTAKDFYDRLVNDMKQYPPVSISINLVLERVDFV